MTDTRIRAVNPNKAERIVLLSGFSFEFVSRIANSSEFQPNIERLIEEKSIIKDDDSEFEKYDWVRESSYASDRCNIIMIVNEFSGYHFFYY